LGKKKRVYFSNARAEKVFKAIDDTWLRRGKDGVLNGLVLPQNTWPPQNHGLTDLELTFFLLCAVLSMRGGIISEVPMKLFWQLYEKRPDFFNPKKVSNKSSALEIEKQLIELLISNREKEEERKIRTKITARFEDVQISFKFISKEKNEKTEINLLDSLQEKFRKIREVVKGYKLDEISRSWFHNMNVLNELWDGDLRNVFKGVNDFEEAFGRIDYKRNDMGFIGMRRKIFSLLTIWLQEFGLIPIFPTPIPIDSQALRILWATEIIKETFWTKLFEPQEKHPIQLAGKESIRVYEPFVDQVTIWSQNFMQEHGFSHLHINPAIWLLGRNLCRKSFQNSSKAESTVYFEPKALLENPDLWPRNYKDLCYFCPIAEYCKWAIPLAPYYRWGLLVKIGERIPYFQPRFSWEDKQKLFGRKI